MAKAELRVLQKLNAYEFGVEVWMMRSGVNNNNWDYQNIQQHYLTFVGQPILCAFPYGRVADGHNMIEKRDANGEKYYSFIGRQGLEQIVGTLSEDPNDFSLVEKDGETWIVAKGRIFTFYARELVQEIIKKGIFAVSVETDILESHPDESNPDIEVFTNWVGLGVTILHDTVAPAVPGANIQELKALASDFKELKLKVASLINSSEDGDGDPDDPDGTEEREKEKEGDINDPDDPDDPDPDNDNDPDEPDNDNDNDPDDPQPSEPKTQKPQNSKLSKGEKSMKVFSKRQCADIAPKFDGYTVLRGGQDDKGYHFCLMAADGTTATYSMSKLDDLIDMRNLQKFEPRIPFAFGEEQIEVDAYAMLSDLGDAASSAKKELEEVQTKLSAELATAQATIETMKASEAKRRLSAAKSKALSTLEQFNANRSEKVSKTVLDSVNEAIENGDYSECMNGEGEWCGEEKVENDVLSKCAKEVMKYDQANVARNSSQYVWGDGKEASGRGEGVGDLLAYWEAETI